MRTLFLVLIAGIICSCTNVVQHGKADSAAKPGGSASFGGVYAGMTPCADCPGIYKVAAFLPDGKYTENLKYLERNAQFADTGKWVRTDSLISVRLGKDSMPAYYKWMNDSAIQMLDADKHPIDGPLAGFYILKKKDTVLQK